jgi:UDP-galactopyranose mutase
MSRFARNHRVIFWEEPVIDDRDEATLDVVPCPETGVIVVTPQLPRHLGEAQQEAVLRSMLEIYLAGQQGPFVRWYYTPMMLPFSRQIDAAWIVYDCTDELADRRSTSPRRPEIERELLDIADVVFAGGDKLDEARKAPHANVRLFPSSADFAQIVEARGVEAMAGG